MKAKLLLILSAIHLPILAEVVTDGTLGQNVNLSGPDFQITSDLGQQHGANLFHSFQDFNLNSLESATFSGTNSVQNIISRVTGGNPSNIDGLIRSTIPNADMYFLNPYGIMFGPNAQLDVQGSFHTSTADYLRLGNEGKFDVRNPQDSLLTIAPISAFGFLTDNPAPITIDNSRLSIPDGKTFSFIGGDLDIKGEDFFYSADWFNRPFKLEIEDDKSAIIRSKGGYIDLISLSERGEANIQGNELKVSEKIAGGNINIHNTHIDASSEGGTHIFIYGGDIKMVSTGINAEAYGDKRNTKIDIKADDLMFEDSSFIMAANTIGTGKGGGINIEISNDLTMSGLHPRSAAIGKEKNWLNMNWITASAFDKGETGTIKIRANNMTLLDASQIDNSVLGDGYIKEQAIDIKITGTLTIAGEHPTTSAIPSGIASSNESIRSNKSADSEGGFVEVEANKIIIRDGGVIATFSLGAGNAGNISVKANEELIISGAMDIVNDPYPDDYIEIYPWASGITAQAVPVSVEDTKGGKSGNIDVKARKIILKNGGQISTLSLSKGPGGNINITADEIFIEGQEMITWDSIEGKQEVVFNSSITSGLYSVKPSTDSAGNITIVANKMSLNNNAEITTQTANAAGGDINITVPEILYIKGGTISTSANGGTRDGGNINIENPIFIVLNNGQIKAQADAGHGGNINIKSEQFIVSPDSLLSASSKLGIDGNVQIDSVDMDIDGALVNLQNEFTEASGQMKKPCSMRGSSFIVKQINGSPQTPYDYQPSHILSNNTNTASNNQAEQLAYNSIGCKRTK